MASIAFSINEAAKAAGVDKYTIIEAIRDGHVAGIPVDMKMYVDGSSLTDWVASLLN